MAGLNREQLIGGLAAEFNKDKGLDVEIESSNFIEPTNSLDCTAYGLSMDTLEKTKNVAEKYLKAFKKQAGKDNIMAQKAIYMEVAIKCITEIMVEKTKK